MNNNDKIKQDTINDWRKLGFFYDTDKDKKEWIFIGTYIGIIKLIKILEEYCNNSIYDAIGEHEHYGPYMYLKISTWKEFIIDDNGIYGTKNDIKRIKDIIQIKLNNAHINDTIIIDGDGVNKWNYKIKIQIKEETYNPEDSDEMLWIKQ